jgi:hypothetical protein
VADSVLLIGSPLIALGVTLAIFLAMGGQRGLLARGGIEGSIAGLALGTLIAAHLVVTLVHTHGNPAVFREHPWRFTVVPLAVLAALAMFPQLRVVAVVAAVVWDVHHSGMQTFGLARLYARRAGGDIGTGRTADLLLNHVLYAGPILAGAGLLIHMKSMGAASALGLGLVEPIASSPLASSLRSGLVVLGLAAIGVYAALQWRLARQGHVVSLQAVVLLGATGLTSVVSWGFDPFGMALFTMKLFHCVQYFTLVAVVEREQVARLLGRARERVTLPIAIGVLMVPALIYGAWARLQVDMFRNGLALSLILTVTLMHFWYDGFTWSARRGPAIRSS